MDHPLQLMREGFSATTLRLMTFLLPVGALISLYRWVTLEQWPLTALLYLPLTLLLLWRMPAHRWRVAIITGLIVATTILVTLRYGFSAYAVHAIPLFGSVLLYLLAGPTMGGLFGALSVGAIGMGGYLESSGAWQPLYVAAGPDEWLPVWLGSLVSVTTLTAISLLLCHRMTADRLRAAEAGQAAREEIERLNGQQRALLAEHRDALVQSELRAQAMLHGMPAAMFVTDWSAIKPELDALVAAGHDDPGAYLRANPLEALRLFGLKRDVFVNDRMLEMFDVVDYDQLNALYDPLSIQEHELYFASELLRHGRAQFRSAEQRRGGRPMVVDWSISVVGAGPGDWSRVCGVGADVTESATRERLMETTLNSISEGVTLIDRFQHMTVINPHFLELFDLSPGSLPPGTPYEAVVHELAERGEYGPGDVAHHVAARVDALQQAMDRGGWQYEHTRPNGTILRITGRGTPDGGFVTVYSDITRQERDRAELKQVVDTLSDGVMLLDAQNTMLFANRKMFELTGLEPDASLFDRPVEGFVGAVSEANGLDPDRELRILLGLLDDARSRGSCEVLRVMDEGRYLRIGARRTPRGGCVIGVADVTEVEQARSMLEDALVESDHRLKMLVEGANVAIVTLDQDRRIVSVNPFSRTLFRLRPQVAGDAMQLIARAPERRRREFAEVLGEVYEQGRSREFEMTYPRTDGADLTVLFHLSPLKDGQGAVIGCWLIGTDVSQLRNTERYLEQSARMASLGEMATGIAHEINQPLHIIKLSAQNAQRRLARDGSGADLDLIGQKFDRIVGQVDRAAQIIEHMRQFGRIPSDAPSRFEPGPVLEESLGPFNEAMRLLEVDLRLQLESGLSYWGSHDLFLQAIGGLAAYTIERLRKLEDGPRRLWLRCHGAGEILRIEIVDNGGTLTQAALDGLFSPSMNLLPADQAGWMGLSVSHGLVEKMGGRLLVANDGEGLRFRIELPNVPGPADD